MTTEKFLVLGGSSFYGRNFMKLVAEKGHIAQSMHRPHWSLGYAMPEADYIVNFASQSLVAESWDDPSAWYRANVVDTEKTFRLAKCRRFIHVSTPEVYGSTKGWVGESHHSNPSTPYAASRAAADMAALCLYRARGFPVIITRTANIYGEGQKPPRIIPLALEHKAMGKALSLHGGGTTVRSYIHVKDACEATYKICKEGALGETYHISTRHALTVEELCKMIGVEIGPPIPDRLGKDRCYLLDSSKVRALGWKDRIRLPEWLKSATS
jgi:dTDP-glucose 4,6-dehydratase